MTNKGLQCLKKKAQYRHSPLQTLGLNQFKDMLIQQNKTPEKQTNTDISPEPTADTRAQESVLMKDILLEVKKQTKVLESIERNTGKTADHTEGVRKDVDEIKKTTNDMSDDKKRAEISDEPTVQLGGSQLPLYLLQFSLTHSHIVLASINESTEVCNPRCDAILIKQTYSH